MSRAPSSSLTTSSSPSKCDSIYLWPLAPMSSACLFQCLTFGLSLFRYAEIVNVRLGNGQTRKGQVLEICGRKAVVQVSEPSNYYSGSVSKMRAFSSIYLLKLSLELSLDFRRHRRHRQHAHSLRVHGRCAQDAHLHGDAGSPVQRTGPAHRSRSPRPRRRLP